MLRGVRVLDMSRVLAGPYATQMLANMGATVIKLEQPRIGDETRQWGPPFVETQGHEPLSSYFTCVNLGKRSIGIDFKHESGQKALLSMVKCCDAVVENFPAGKLDAAGIGASAMMAQNPDLVIASITGYGLSGARSSYAAYDIAIQAESGHMSTTGPHPSTQSTAASGAFDGPRAAAVRASEVYKHGVATIDIMTGLHAQNAILAALLDVQCRRADAGLPLRASNALQASKPKTSSPGTVSGGSRASTGQATYAGVGRHLDVSLMDTALHALVNVGSAALNGGSPSQPWGTAHASIVPYQAMQADDGPIVIAAMNDRQFRILCEDVLSGPCSHLPRDARFATNPARVKHRDVLLTAVQGRMDELRGSRQQWADRLHRAGLAGSAVASVEDALHSTHAQERGSIQQIPLSLSPSAASGTRSTQSPTLDQDQDPPSIRAIVPPLRVRRVPHSSHGPANGSMEADEDACRIRGPPPRLGEHTREVLLELGILDDEEITAGCNEGWLAEQPPPQSICSESISVP